MFQRNDLCLYYPLPSTPSNSPLFTQLSGWSRSPSPQFQHIYGDEFWIRIAFLPLQMIISGLNIIRETTIALIPKFSIRHNGDLFDQSPNHMTNDGMTRLVNCIHDHVVFTGLLCLSLFLTPWVGLILTLSVPACFLNFISALSQVQFI